LTVSDIPISALASSLSTCIHHQLFLFLAVSCRLACAHFFSTASPQFLVTIEALSPSPPLSITSNSQSFSSDFSSIQQSPSLLSNIVLLLFPTPLVDLHSQVALHHSALPLDIKLAYLSHLLLNWQSKSSTRHPPQTQRLKLSRKTESRMSFRYITIGKYGQTGSEY
jgi:hypothetical protein